MKHVNEHVLAVPDPVVVPDITPSEVKVAADLPSAPIAKGSPFYSVARDLAIKAGAIDYVMPEEIHFERSTGAWHCKN